MVSFMLVRSRIGILIITIVLGGSFFAYLFFATLQTDLQKKQMFAAAELTRTSKFSSSTHKFSFSYPQPYQVIENSPQAFEVGTVSGRLVHESVDVRVLSVPTDINTDTYVINHAREMCRYEGSAHPTRCTGLNEQTKFASDMGVPGFKFYLKAEIYNPETQDAISEKRVGPFFALAISQHTYVLISPPLTEISDKNVRLLPYIIAESFSIFP